MTGLLERLTTILADRYRVEREIGSGGMATVYLAHDRRYGREVAVKVLHPALASTLGTQRFLREIEIAARLVHPHILSLLDSGESDGLLYYVMPYVTGDSLRARLRREGELPVEDALRILRDVVGALAYAHGQGIIHRDIKPENVLFVGAHAQLTDFGIAKALHEASAESRLTATGLALGTPAYMAPEQAAGDSLVDHRSDLYSIGVLAYEMLVGAVPFAGQSAQQMMTSHLVRAIEPVVRIRSSVPVPVSALVMRCLEKRPADRWQSADELLRQLEAHLTPATTLPNVAVEREIETCSFRLGEEVCRRLTRASFDPRMIGDAMRYLDNGVESDVLVCYISRWGADTTDRLPVLRASRYRTIAPTLFGFEPGRQIRYATPIEDHLTLIGALVDDLAARLHPRFVVLAGFSAGGDMVLRLGAGEGSASRIDGCLSLGSNLGLETCFVTKVLAQMNSGADADLLPAVNAALGATDTLNDWLSLGEYLVNILHNFRRDVAPLVAFARGIVAPFERSGLEAFIGWYRSATGAGRRLRCVFEDSALYRDRVRELQFRNVDHGVLGDRYEPESLVVEPNTGHFDLESSAMIDRHLEALLTRLRTSSPRA